MNTARYTQYSAHSSPIDNASMISRGSIRLEGAPSQQSSRTSVGSNAEFLIAGNSFVNMNIEADSPGGYGYYLDRGDGQFTKLIPADLLPPMSGIPPREEEHDGMIILPSLQNMQPRASNGGIYHHVLPKVRVAV